MAKREGGRSMKDERKFKEVIHTIKGAEKDKDRFCKAARIEREPMSDKRLVTLLNYAVGTLAMVMGFAALYMVIYFMGTSGR